MDDVTNEWDVGCTLGEGPVWAEQALWFVDIKAPAVHRFDPASGERRSWPAPQQVGFLFPAHGGGFVAGLQSGLHRFDPSQGSFEKILDVEPDRPTNRLNDGAVDPEGRLWFGTMDDSERSESGAFYCYQRGKLTRTELTGIAITNGPAISPDGRKLYWVDTRRGTTGVCEIDSNGTLGASRPFVRIDRSDGHPDGAATDSEGCVWISLFGGWEARRYSPAGELLDRVRFPVANITKVAFGGPDLATGFATTARLHLSPEQCGQQPGAGDLFSFKPGVTGFECPAVEL